MPEEERRQEDGRQTPPPTDKSGGEQGVWMDNSESLPANDVIPMEECEQVGGEMPDSMIMGAHEIVSRRDLSAGVGVKQEPSAPDIWQTILQEGFADFDISSPRKRGADCPAGDRFNFGSRVIES
jgi:hypothetical protein